MKQSRVGVVAVLGVVAVFSRLPLTSASAQSSDKPTAADVGVTPTEIRIAVLADVDNSFAPGLFQGAVNGVKGAAKYLNSKAGGGGIGKRKLVVDFIDTKVNPTVSRNATIEACQNDLAMVGTTMVFLTNVDDIVSCKDNAGQATGLPDIASATTSPVEACAPTSFSSLGVIYDCATMNQTPQTYRGNRGSAKWLASTNKDLHGLLLYASDTQEAARGGQVGGLQVEAGGIKFDQKIGVSGTAPQSAYTPFIQQMKNSNANYSLNTSSVASALALRNEAQLQGFNPSGMVWDCVSCYGQKTVTDNAAAFEGEYQSLNYLPFTEGKYNKTLAMFNKYVGPDADQFTAYAWVATLAFAQAARNVVEQHGVNGLTRANLIPAIKALTSFDAGGMAGAHSFATGAGSPCFVEVQFKGGEWKRVYPKKPGTMDCKTSNAVNMQANLNANS